MDFLWSGPNVASGTLGGVLAVAAGADRKGGGNDALPPIPNCRQQNLNLVSILIVL